MKRIFSLVALLILLATLGSFVGVPTTLAAPITHLQVGQLVLAGPYDDLTPGQQAICDALVGIGAFGTTDECASNPNVRKYFNLAPVAPRNPAAPGAGAPTTVVSANCNFPAPAVDLNTMPKTTIELAPQGQWFHRVFNTRLFHAPDWGGADSFHVTTALGSNSGGNWISYGNSGQIQYRANSTNINWCFGVLTTGQYKSQSLSDSKAAAVGLNVKISAFTPITVTTSTGKTITQNTSDQGDIQIILPENGVTTISVSYSTQAPSHESQVWWGPRDREDFINTIDAR